LHWAGVFKITEHYFIKGSRTGKCSSKNQISGSTDRDLAIPTRVA